MFKTKYNISKPKLSTNYLEILITIIIAYKQDKKERVVYTISSIRFLVLHSSTGPS